MVKLLLFYFNLYLFFIIYLFNFNLFSKVLIDKNIKDIFLEEIEFEGIKNTGNKLEVVENNESIKVTDNYFIKADLPSRVYNGRKKLCTRNHTLL